jgi:ketosteroid isomerase-like protein
MTRSLWFVAICTGVTISAQTDSQSLPRMVATERAFAAATAEVGVRDGFLTFFADDAIRIAAGRTGAETTVQPARDGLRASAEPLLPLRSRLIWAPFTGQVSSDGSVGWLTGGYANVSNINEVTRDVLGAGAYFSVWKHQPDGTWKVWLDEGISLPQTWRDATPFRAAPDPDPGADGSASETIVQAEQSIVAGGAAWRGRTAVAMRLHRDGVMPLEGRDAATAWASAAWRTVHFSVIKTEVAASADLGIAIGGYDATRPDGAPEHGTFVRVWKRDSGGRWRIVFETSAPH